MQNELNLGVRATQKTYILAGLITFTAAMLFTILALVNVNRSEKDAAKLITALGDIAQNSALAAWITLLSASASLMVTLALPPLTLDAYLKYNPLARLSACKKAYTVGFVSASFAALAMLIASETDDVNLSQKTQDVVAMFCRTMGKTFWGSLATIGAATFAGTVFVTRPVIGCAVKDHPENTLEHAGYGAI